MAIPTIDLWGDSAKVSKQIVKACENYGFFMVVNHGVPVEVIQSLEQQGFMFFARSVNEKLRARPRPPNPLGYGRNNIGPNGDTGELEYLSLEANPHSIAQRSRNISNNPSQFSYAANAYVEAITGLTCRLLDLMAEGLSVYDKSVFSRLIMDSSNDSILRLNHYPPVQVNRIGFGEHSDPQIFTVLRSNDVAGLQIMDRQMRWVRVPANPNAFCVFVGDTLQAMTNGRFESVRHRAVTNSVEPRMSIAFFAAPSCEAMIAAVPVPEMTAPNWVYRYRPYTWDEYKRKMYTLPLGEYRLNHFLWSNTGTDDGSSSNSSWNN